MLIVGQNDTTIKHLFISCQQLFSLGWDNVTRSGTPIGMVGMYQTGCPPTGYWKDLGLVTQDKSGLRPKPRDAASPPDVLCACARASCVACEPFNGCHMVDLVLTLRALVRL